VTLRERLKSETAQIHEAIEALLPFSTMTLDQYGVVLLRFYHFYQKFEADHVARGARGESASQFYLAGRQKLAWLESDLKDLKLWPPPSSTKSFSLEFRNEAEVWGSLYVIEGSTLGGQVISKMLQEKWGLSSAKGARFFSAYERETGLKWREVISQLEARPAPEAEDAVLGARKTFAALYHEMEKPQN
jgi:heme oxygenase